jgi:hypothetical protein
MLSPPTTKRFRQFDLFRAAGSIVQAWLHVQLSTDDVVDSGNTQPREQGTSHEPTQGQIRGKWASLLLLGQSPSTLALGNPTGGFSYPFQVRTQIFCGTSLCVVVLKTGIKTPDWEGWILPVTLQYPAPSSRAQHSTSTPEHLRRLHNNIHLLQ